MPDSLTIQIQATGAQATQAAIRGVIATLQDGAKQANAYGSSLQRIGEIAAGLGLARLAEQGIGAVKDAMVEGVAAAFQYNAAIQQQAVTFEVLIGSAERANEAVRGLIQTANETPLSSKAVLQLGRDFLVAGVGVDDLDAKIRTYGNLMAVTSGINDDAANRLGRVIQQISAAGKLYAQDANQLRELNIPIYKALAEAYGITSEEARKFGEQGKISSDAALFALERFSQSHAADAMAKAIEKPAAALDLLKTNAETARARALEPLTKVIDDLVIRFAKFTQTEEFARDVDMARAAVERLVNEIKENAIPALTELGNAFQIALGKGGEGGSPDEFMLQVAVAVDALARIFATETKLMIQSIAAWAGMIGASVRIVIDNFKGLGDVMDQFFNRDPRLATTAKNAIDQMGKDFSDFGRAVELGVKTTNESIRAIPESFEAARRDIDAILNRPSPAPKGPTPNKPGGAAPNLGGIDAEAMAKELAKVNKAIEEYNTKWTRAAEDRAAEDRKILGDYARETLEVRSKLNADLIEKERVTKQRIDAILDEMVAARADADRRIAEINSDLADRLVEIEKARAQKVADLTAQEEEAARASAEKRAEIAAELNRTLVALAQDAADKVAELDRQARDQRVATLKSIEDANRELEDRIRQIRVDAANKLADLERQRTEAVQNAADRIADAEQTLADRRAAIAKDLADRLAGIEESTQEKLARIKEKYGPDAGRATRRGLTDAQREALRELEGTFGTDIGALQAAMSGRGTAITTGPQLQAAQILLKELIAQREQETKAAIDEGNKQAQAAKKKAFEEKQAAEEAKNKVIAGIDEQLTKKLTALDEERRNVQDTVQYEIEQQKALTLLKIGEINERDRQSQLAYENERSRIDLEYQHAVTSAQDRARDEIAEVNRTEIERQAKFDAEMVRINTEATEAGTKAAQAATDKIAEINRVNTEQVTKHSEQITRIMDEARIDKEQAVTAANARIAEINRVTTEALTAFNTRKQRALADMKTEYDAVMALISAYTAANAAASKAPAPAPAPFPDMTTNNVPVFDNGGILREPVIGTGLRTGTRYGFALTGPEAFGGVQRSYDGRSVGLSPDEAKYLAKAIADAVSRQPIILTVDDRVLGAVNRRLDTQFALRNESGSLGRRG